MQRLVLGFVLGLVIGGTLGWMLGVLETPAGPERVRMATPRETVGNAPDADLSTPDRPAANRRVRIDPQADRPDRRSRREPHTTGPAPPEPRDPASATPELQTPPEGGSPEEALAELTAVAFGNGGSVPHELVNRVVQADLLVPWETVLALAARGFGALSGQLLATWPEDMLRRALDLATDDGHADVAALRAIARLAAWELTSRTTPTDADVAALASHDDPRLRQAAAQLAYATDPPEFDRLVAMAQADPDDSVRTTALEMLAWVATEDGDPALLERALPALAHAARHGSLDLRRTAIENLPDAGPGAAAVALEIFQEEGVDPDLLATLAAAAVRGGRLGDLLSGARTEEQRRAISTAFTDYLDLEPEVMRRHAQGIAALAVNATTDEAYDVYWLLHDAGANDVVAAAATNTRVPTAARRAAFDVLFEDDEPDFRAAAVDAARAVLLGGAGGVSLRRHVVGLLGDWDWSDSESLAASVHEILVSVAANDSNSWVRGMAAEVLAEWDSN